jgi:hypothetical protein
MSHDTDPSLSYAVAEPSFTQRIWAGVAIVFAGLGLVVLGGCFLIGVMLLSTDGFGANASAVPLTRAALLLILVLYALAFVCFGCAVLVIVAGLRALFKVVHNR